MTAMNVALNLMVLPPLEESGLAANDYMSFCASFLNVGSGRWQNRNSTSSDNPCASTNKSCPAVDFPVLLQEDKSRQHIQSLFCEVGVEITPEMRSQLP